MLLGTRKNLYDHIIEALLEKSRSVADIENYLSSQKVRATVQGVYKALRELIAEDIVIKEKKTYLISSVWREKLQERIMNRARLQLSAGEQTIYRFKKIAHLDAFWKHTMHDIQSEWKEFPVFHANPHNFWYLVPGRKESEEEYYENFVKTKTPVFSLIGGTTGFDKQLKQLINDDFQKFHFDQSFPFNRRDHLSIVGPYIVTTRISVPLANQIDSLYVTCKTEQELLEKVIPLFKKYGSITMTVEHNEIKAKKLTKRIAADFYISKELREKFNLF